MEAYLLVILILSLGNRQGLFGFEVRPFGVVFRVPAKRCIKADTSWNDPDYKISPSDDGFEINPNNQDDGLVVSMDFNVGKWPYYKYLPNSEIKVVNGGLPQQGNLPDHLKAVEEVYKTKNYDKYIPDSSFSIIGFQKWRLSYRQNIRWDRLIYQTGSTMRILKDPFRYNKSDVNKEAQEDFEKNSRAYFKGTLAKIKSLKNMKNAKVGFMGYPTCYYKHHNPTNSCSPMSMSDNERFYDVFKDVDAYYPFIQLPDPLDYLGTFDDRDLYVMEKVSIARYMSRVLSEFQQWVAPIVVPYYARTKRLVLEEDMVRLMVMPCLRGADSVIIWSSIDRMSTRDQCREFRSYYYRNFRDQVKHPHNCSLALRSSQKFITGNITPKPVVRR